MEVSDVGVGWSDPFDPASPVDEWLGVEFGGTCHASGVAMEA